MSMISKMKMPRVPGYLLATMATSLAGFLNGYDTGSIGAVTVMHVFEESHGVLSPFMRGFVVSVAMLAGAFPAFISGQLANRHGHLKVLSLGGIFLTIGNLMECIAPNLGVFIAGRLIAGLGQGIVIGIAPVYICEIAPASSRGTLVSFMQITVTGGICLGYFTCYGTVKMDNSLSWRLPYVVQIVASVILAASCTRLPSSPRWLMLQRRPDEALQAVERLGIMRAEAEKDILKEPNEEETAKPMNPIQETILVFRSQYRTRTSLALLILAGIQLSGIDGIIYYAPLLFQQAGLPEQTAGFLASGVSAILMMIVTIPAVLLADRWGRRTSLITGGIMLSSCMYIIGSLFASGSVRSGSPAAYTVVALIFLFALTYCMTWAIAGKIYASEIQPAKTRASANAVAQALGFFTNWLVALITPIFLAKSTYGPYFLYGSLSLAMVVALVLFMPETRGQPLEAIDEIFSKPMIRSWWNVKQLFSRATAAVSERSSSSGSDAASTPREGASGQASIELQDFMNESQLGQDVPVRPASMII